MNRPWTSSASVQTCVTENGRSLAYFRGKWWLYYNGADWVACVATAEADPKHFAVD